jgi:dipeptidyl aminopeptidase/acylaminoacyl peptidase
MKKPHIVMSRRSVAKALAAAALSPSAFVVPAAANTPRPGAPAPGTVPLDILFSRPAYSGLSLSPSQRYLAAIVPMGDRQNIAVLDLESRTAARITSMTDTDVNSVSWANENRLVFTTGDLQGLTFESNGRVFGVDRDGRNGRSLIDPPAARGGFVARTAVVAGRVRGSEDEMLVFSNDRSATTVDVYRLNVNNGRRTLVNETSPGNVVSWVLDASQTPRATFSSDRPKRRYAFHAMLEGAKDWKLIAEWDEQLNNVIVPLAFDPAGPNRMYVASNRGRDTLALYSMDLASGELGPLIYGDDRYDIASFGLISPAGGAGLIFGSEDGRGKLLGLRYTADKPKVVWFDEAAARTQASVDAALPGLVNSFGVTQKRSLVFSRSDVEPGRYFIYDQERQRMEDTGIRTRPNIDPRQMRPMQPVTWKARDGLTIDGYLTLPANWTKGQPVPLVIHPHGGPWVRDNWGYNREVQFMANRGFAVLQPNFRGSTGYGARHLRLSYRQWGGTMIDDMIAGVEWAIAEGYADPQRLGVYGASYGGYSALMMLVRRPEMFKWGINYVGVTDMEVHQDTQPAQLFGDFGELAKVLNGDKRQDKEMFVDQSPARHVDRIRAPVLHAYGGLDRNVDFANGRVIRSAFERANKPFEWMFVADEAHGYVRAKNVLEYYGRMEAFMLKHTPQKA